jgi:cysteine desulfurase / selenocysteine lyase
MTDTNHPAQPTSPSRGAAEVSVGLRAQMPICQRFAYFDHAAVAPLPAASAAAIKNYATEASELGDTPWMDWSRRVELLRGEFAQLVGAGSDEIAMIPNTSTGIGLVAEGWRWQPGDSVVVPANEFPSNLAPWRQLRRRGVEVREVPVPVGNDGLASLQLDMILKAMDATTRMVAVSWVGFVSGWRINVAQFCEAVHRRGALLFLDAIQGLGAFPLDVRGTGVDFCAADGHKWMLGPEGAGMLYVRGEHIERLDPLMIGWHSLDERAAFDPANTNLKHTAARFEGGSANMAGLLGLERSVRLLLDHGAHLPGSGFAEAILRNVDELQTGLKRIGCQGHVPQAHEHRSGIMTITWPDDATTVRDPLAARKFCLSQGIVTSVRGGRLRVSTHAYNNSDDIERFIAALDEFLRR